MRVLSRQRPELMLLAALLLLAAVLAGRALRDEPAQIVAVNTDAPAPAPLEAGSAQLIARLQAHLRANPDDGAAYAQLGLALLERVRETADPTLYAQAQQALDAALERDPGQLDALVGQGLLALSRHQFAEAIEWGERARAVNPYRAQVYGIIGDAQVELGQYEAAASTIQTMVDTRPDLSSYSRVAYIRELNGDTAGAIEAMRLAVSAGGRATEPTLWAQVQLGHLYFNSGDLARAEQTYMEALQARPDYAYAFAGVARVRAAQGRHAEAIEFYATLAERLPLPEFVVALGDLYEAVGDAPKAQAQRELVRAIQQLNAEGGVDVDLELALFDADHGADPAAALARARRAYERRPSIYAADALAWALHRDGQHAQAHRYSQEALRLGTRDAALRYRAGMIAQANGDSAAAQAHLAEALAINPFFSVRDAPMARQLLREMKAEG